MDSSIRDMLLEHVDQTIAVTWTTVPLEASGFHTSMSVRGVLESKDSEHYRVLVNDDSYVYFDVASVEAIIPYSKGYRVYIGHGKDKEDYREELTATISKWRDRLKRHISKA